MSLTNPNKPVTEQRLSEFYQQILPFLGGMPDILANKFARGDMYSTDEKMIGRWIDGKPLYQKVYTLSSAVTVSNSSFTTISEIDASTMDRTFNVFGVSESADYSCPMMLTTEEGYFKVMTLRNDNSIRVKYVTLQYTKTTDSPVEIGNDTDYSTEEKIIGTWIDGKPIYQKTFVSTMPTTSANGTQVTKYIEIDASVDTAVLAQGFSKSTNAWQTFPRLVENINTSNNKILYNRIAVRPESAESNKNTVAIISNMIDSNGLLCHVTIQYTKTTD